MKKKLSNLIAIASALVLAWFFLSYIDCIINIDSQAYDYAWWNVITLMFRKQMKQTRGEKYNANKLI